jgi:hypothetical protein
MQENGLFGETGSKSEVQSGLILDDGSGLRVVSAKFQSEVLYGEKKTNKSN